MAEERAVLWNTMADPCPVCGAQVREGMRAARADVSASWSHERCYDPSSVPVPSRDYTVKATRETVLALNGVASAVEKVQGFTLLDVRYAIAQEAMEALSALGWKSPDEAEQAENAAVLEYVRTKEVATIKIETTEMQCNVIDAAIHSSKREHRHEWAGYFENWSGAIGPEPLTVEKVIAALRSETVPFGRCKNVGTKP